MNEPTLWWVLAGSVVAVELMTGTFYLLMLSFGFVAAALAAHAGVELPGQLIAAAAFGGGSVLLGRRYRKKIATSLSLGGSAEMAPAPSSTEAQTGTLTLPMAKHPAQELTASSKSSAAG
jgi:membrane protein implicated in regulation of membrane protease activity